MVNWFNSWNKLDRCCGAICNPFYKKYTVDNLNFPTTAKNCFLYMINFLNYSEESIKIKSIKSDILNDKGEAKNWIFEVHFLKEKATGFLNFKINNSRIDLEIEKNPFPAIDSEIYKLVSDGYYSEKFLDAVWDTEFNNTKHIHVDKLETKFLNIDKNNGIESIIKNNVFYWKYFDAINKEIKYLIL